MRRLGTAAVALLLVSACTTGDSSGGQVEGGDPAAALKQWASFPVTASPRLPLLTDRTILDPPGGFQDGALADAYGTGTITAPEGLSSTPPKAGVISSAAAFTALNASGTQVPLGTVPALRPTYVRLETATFATDRGPTALPAWTFGFHGAHGHASVLALPAGSYYPPSTTLGGGPYSIAADDRRITVQSGGAPIGPPPCGSGGIRLHTVESATAVVVSVETLPAKGKRTSGNCPAILKLLVASTTLDRPLGNRVLVNDRGVPLTRVATSLR